MDNMFNIRKINHTFLMKIAASEIESLVVSDDCILHNCVHSVEVKIKGRPLPFTFHQIDGQSILRLLVITKNSTSKTRKHLMLLTKGSKGISIEESHFEKEAIKMKNSKVMLEITYPEGKVGKIPKFKTNEPKKKRIKAHDKKRKNKASEPKTKRRKIS